MGFAMTMDKCESFCDLTDHRPHRKASKGAVRGIGIEVPDIAVNDFQIAFNIIRETYDTHLHIKEVLVFIEPAVSKYRNNVLLSTDCLELLEYPHFIDEVIVTFRPSNTQTDNLPCKYLYQHGRWQRSSTRRSILWYI
jgi:hypothetical protein